VAQLDPDFWRGRRVLVTGSSGFKGAWLSLLLRRLGAEVTGLSLQPPTEPSLFQLVSVADQIDQHVGDVRDAKWLRSVVDEARPELVFHLAAQALVLEGFADPIGTYASNVMGTVHLLQALRTQESARVLVNVTTDKVYASGDGRPHPEDDRLGGAGPYSASKVCSEVVTEAAASWAKQRGLAVATARSGNTLGGGDWAANRLVPDCVRAAASGGSLAIRHPGAVRPWQFVLDSLAGYILLAESLAADPERFEGAWNFAPPPFHEPPVHELASAVLTGLGAAPATIEEQRGAPPEAAVLRLDSAKARAELGWRPQLDWRACVEWTVAWYRGWLDGDDLEALTSAQLDRYLDMHSRQP